MKSFRMRMTSIVLSVLLLASMVIPAFAADSPECLSASSFSGAEVAFFESQGIDFGKVVKISYENTAITAVDSKTRSKMTNDVDFIRFDMKDGNVITSTSIIFTDESGNPVSARSVMNGSIFNYGSQSGSVSYQHITATIRYILYTDGLTITCVNPGYVGVSMSVACSSLTADYLAYGYLTVYTPSGSGYTYTQSATTMYASIPLVRANTVAGVVYSATGSWNGYCLPTNQGVALVHDITVGHPHTVSYDYTTSSGVRYYGGLAF